MLLHIGTCTKCNKPTLVENSCCKAPVLSSGQCVEYGLKKWDFPTAQKYAKGKTVAKRQAPALYLVK